MAIILIDFDNTITERDMFPEIAPIRKGAVEVINKFYDLGHCIIINTCREGDHIIKVKNYLNENGVKFCHVNENCEVLKRKYNNDTRKIAGHINIDDKNLDILYYGEINWFVIFTQLEKVLQKNYFEHEKCNKRVGL